MVQSPAQPAHLTLEAFLGLPETKPASEYVDGHILLKPIPQGKHSALQGELIILLQQTLKPSQVARVFPGLRCTFGGRSTVPDIAIFTWDRIPRDNKGQVANVFAQAPDWTIEILSPEQGQLRVVKNILHALDHGCQMGWLIAPDEQTILTYQPQQQPQVFDQLDQRIPVPPFAQSLHLTLGSLFALLE